MKKSLLFMPNIKKEFNQPDLVVAAEALDLDFDMLTSHLKKFDDNYGDQEDVDMLDLDLL